MHNSHTSTNVCFLSRTDFIQENLLKSSPILSGSYLISHAGTFFDVDNEASFSHLLKILKANELFPEYKV